MTTTNEIAREATPQPIEAQTSHSLQSDPLKSRSIFEKEKYLFRPFCYAPTLHFAAVMPIGKIAQTSGKAPDYSSGSTNIQHATQQSKPSLPLSSRPPLLLLLPPQAVVRQSRATKSPPPLTRMVQAPSTRRQNCKLPK